MNLFLPAFVFGLCILVGFAISISLRVSEKTTQTSNYDAPDSFLWGGVFVVIFWVLFSCWYFPLTS